MKDPTKILTRDEVRAVLADLKQRIEKSGRPLIRSQLIVFRLACCCGLRRAEIAKLRVGDVLTSGARPAIGIRKDVGKGRKERIVPLWWDRGTLEDLKAWKRYRIDQGATNESPFIAAVKHDVGTHVTGETIGKRWRQAIKVLGPERVHQVASHSGRRSFCSHTLAIGRTLPEVQQAAGHSNVATTSIYLYPIDSNVEDAFA